jgi:diguanylate cyclase (GGDEF)-like protein
MLACLGVLVAETVVGLGAAGDAIVGRFADDLVIVLAAALCLMRAHDEPRGGRGPWLLLTCALVAWALGNGFQSLALWGRPYTGATLSDAGWIALYPLSALAFLALARAHLGRLDLRLGIDAVIGALALLALFAGDIRETAEGSVHSTGAWVSAAYTVADLVLIAIAAAIGSAARWQLDRLWLVLLAGFMVTVVGDRLYSEDVAVGRLDNAAIVATVWSCGAALIGLSSAVALPPVRPQHCRPGAIGLPTVLAFGALAVVLYSSVGPVDPVGIVLAAGSLGAALVRLALTHRDNAILLAEADERAHADSLTGLGNRRAFTRDVERMAGALREGSRLRVSLFDLDGFKAYNDRRGHVAGDELLERISRRMRAAVAGQGLCYRLGGDEFCLLMEVGDGESELVTARAAAALSDDDVRCSHGSVTLEPGTSLAQALRLADERMYAHKRGRRGFAALGSSQSAAALVAAASDRRSPAHRRADAAYLGDGEAATGD